MSTIAFRSHGVEFELVREGSCYTWKHGEQFGDLFLSVGAAKCDAHYYAARITTGTVPKEE